tara:strand:- start:104 stop:1132 length:1029 start_codon:yes stop_codon:yes gene_type:complete
MRFYEYPDSYIAIRNSGLAESLGIGSRSDMYMWFLNQSGCMNSLGIRHLSFDATWNAAGRPYYDVYPSIIPLLTKLNLNIPGTCVSKSTDSSTCAASWFNTDITGEKFEDLVKKIEGMWNFPPVPQMLIRLPEVRHELTYEDSKFGVVSVRTIFVSFQPVNLDVGVDKQVIGLVIGVDIGERDETGIVPIHTMKVFPLDDKPIEELINTLLTHPTSYEGMQIPDDIMTKCVKLAITIRLLDDDPEIITPDVLTKDRHRMAEADEELKRTLIERARKKGKYAFVVGECIEKGETNPHYRRPHPALVWTSKGRVIPKIVWRKGSVVHREKIETIPTGYGGEEIV